MLDTYNANGLISISNGLISISNVRTFKFKNQCLISLFQLFPLPIKTLPSFQDWVRLKCGISNTDKINLQITKDQDQALISIFTIQEFSVLDFYFILINIIWKANVYVRSCVKFLIMSVHVCFQFILSSKASITKCTGKRSFSSMCSKNTKK